MSNPRLLLSITSALALALLPLAALAQPSVQESAFWSQEVSAGDLPPPQIASPLSRWW